MPITRFPAAQMLNELLGVDKDRGAIRPGLAADLIATPGNPLDDVAEQRDLGV